MTDTRQMNAITIDRFGGTDVLHHGPRPIPAITAGQVLVEVAYAGVGTWDPLMREGAFAEITGEAPAFPMILGTDGSGTVAAVGADVTGLEVGDAVYFIGAGTYAGFVALDADAVSKVPDGVPLDQAGAMPVAALTALHGLVDELGIGAGDSVLINGASGDVGHLAVQIAGLLGARVLAVASGDDGVRMARELGADVAVDGRKDDVGAAARAFAPEGLDGVLTFVTGPGLDAAVAATRSGGRVAYPLGVEPEPSPRDGVTSHQFDLTMDAPEVVRAKMTRLNALVGPGPFAVRIAEIVPLADVARAHQALGQHRLGKIVLAVGAGSGGKD